MTNEINKNSQPLANHSCPLCGGPNGCAPAISGDFDSVCWCIETKITPELLSRVPEALRGKSCICKACALGQ